MQKVILSVGTNPKTREMVQGFFDQEYPEAIVEFTDVVSDDEFIKLAQGAKVVISQQQQMNDKIYKSLPELQAFCALGIGFNSGNVEAATPNGVIVTNVPDYCTDEVATHTVALMLAFQRGLYKMVPWIKEGNWGIEPIVPRWRMAESTIGLYGFGGIARDVAKKLTGFGVRVITNDPFVNEDLAKDLNVEIVSFDELIEQSDIVSLHAPLLPSTEGIFNEEIFKKMKPHAYIVNCARGPLIDHKALYKALTEGWIAGAGLDVVEHEPVPGEDDWKVIGLPNVWATGHSAFYSTVAHDDLWLKAIQESVRILKGEQPRSCVNKDVLSSPALRMNK